MKRKVSKNKQATDKNQPMEQIRLNASVSDFDRAFERNLASQPTYKAAYEATEQEHQSMTGHRRYSDHDSYRVSRSRRIKKRK